MYSPGILRGMDSPETLCNVSSLGTLFDMNSPGTLYDMDSPGTLYDMDSPGTLCDMDSPGTLCYMDSPGAIYNLNCPETSYHTSDAEEISKGESIRRFGVTSEKIECDLGNGITSTAFPETTIKVESEWNELKTQTPQTMVSKPYFNLSGIMENRGLINDISSRVDRLEAQLRAQEDVEILLAALGLFLLWNHSKESNPEPHEERQIIMFIDD